MGPSHATAALERALALDAGNLRAQVLLGILDARHVALRRGADALESRQRIDAAYPNIDRLIDGAERRKARP